MHPHIESLSSIKVFPFGGQKHDINYFFLDLIVLYDIFDWGDELKSCFFKDSELKEINPIYQSFIRIKEIYFNNYEEAFAKLTMLKQVSIQEIESINFGKMSNEEVEQITYQLLNYKIHYLNYYVSWESVSNQTLENISRINPQELHQLILAILNFILILNIEIDINFNIKVL